MKRVIAVSALLAMGFVGAAEAQTWTAPMSGIAFPVHRDGMTLLGAGMRVKKIIFTFKAYTIALYVSDEAIAGQLAQYKGQTTSAAFYHVLQTGDFKKELVLRFMRNLSDSRIQESMRESLQGADPKVLDQFVSYFPALKQGEECTLRWVPGGTLETVMAGQAKPPIADRAFAERLFGLYVGPSPLQADIKAGIVSRAPEVIR